MIFSLVIFTCPKMIDDTKSVKWMKGGAPEPEQKKRTRLTRPVEGQGEFSLCRTLTRHVFVIFHISHVFEFLFVGVGRI